MEVNLAHQGPAYLDEEYPIVIQVTNTDVNELDITVDILLQPPEVDGTGTDGAS